MSQTRTLACKACGAANDVLVPDDSFGDQMTYASMQFSCRLCGAELAEAEPPAAEGAPKAEPKRS